MEASHSSNDLIPADLILDTLTRIATQIHQSPSFDECLDQAVTAVRELLQGDRVLIYQFVPYGNGLMVAESLGGDWASLKGQLIYDPCFDKWVVDYHQGRVSAIADIHADPLTPCYIELLSRFQVRANLVAPIPAQGLPWGLMMVHQCQGPRTWQPWEIQVLKQVALNLGLAIQYYETQQQFPSGSSVTPGQRTVQENFELELELNTRNRELATLHRLSEITLSAESLQKALQRITEEISHAVNFPIVAIERYDPVHQTMVFVGVKGIPVPGDRPLAVPVSQTLSGTVAQTQQPLVKLFAPDEDRPCDGHAVLRQLGVSTFICYPLVIQKRVLGVLSLAHPESLSPAMIQPLHRWVGSLANYIASLIDRKQTEEKLQQRLEQMRLNAEITQQIRRSLDLSEILQTAVTEIQQVLQADRVLVYRVWPNGTGSAIAEAVQDTLPKVLDQIFPEEVFPPEAYAAYVQGRVYTLEDAQTGQVLECLVEFLQELGVRAKLVVPIVQHETLWGLLIAHQIQPRIWQPWAVDLLQQISQQLAIAIQQSELYSQVQQLNNTLEEQVKHRTQALEQSLVFEASLKRITDKVRDSLDERQILQTVVNDLGKKLDLESCNAGIYNTDQTVSTILYEYSKTLSPLFGLTFDLHHPWLAPIYHDLIGGVDCQFCFGDASWLYPETGQLSVFACPIYDDQGALGDLWLYKQAGEVFNELEVRLTQQLANQCAIAIRQSRLYQSAQKQVEELERLNQLKDDFLSTVSHELRTPMSSIKVALQMLELSLKPSQALETTPKADKYFQILKTECQREINLINDLLDLTRLDSSTEVLSLSLVNLEALITQLIHPFLERTRNQKQHLAVQISEGLPLLKTDISYLERILIELLNNACKYTPTEETITLAVSLAPHALEIWVSNSGVEIPPQERDRIFDKFYRIANNDPWKHGGTGLGLALVKKLTHCLGATIQLHCEAQTTTFLLRFPLSQTVDFQ